MFGRKPKIITDEKEIDLLLSRSISNILPDKEVLKQKFMSGERLKIYLGADATGPDLHLGHSTNFFFLERMRQLGHEIIVLFGDFTAMIGDPSDKSAARVRLSKKEVENNIKTWKKQINHVLDLNNKSNPVKVLRNSAWLSKLNFEDIADLASNFTVQQMIERDMFEKRLNENKPIYLHEFFYPLMVGYDSVYLNVDIELGGNDQTFNMLAGRTLQEKMTGKNKFVVSTTLLENPVTGKKLMSKSEGGYVSLQDEPNEMFGKIMALPDETIIPIYKHCTWVSLEEIANIENKLKSEDVNPKDLKLDLAKEIVTIYHNKNLAQKAVENFEKTFSQKGEPENIETVTVNSGLNAFDVVLEKGLVESKSEWKRLVSSNSVSFDGQKISEVDFIIDKSAVLKVGKKRFLKIELKD